MLLKPAPDRGSSLELLVIVYGLPSYCRMRSDSPPSYVISIVDRGLTNADDVREHGGGLAVARGQRPRRNATADDKSEDEDE